MAKNLNKTTIHWLIILRKGFVNPPADARPGVTGALWMVIYEKKE